jgi:hypothetical protein
MNNNDKCVCPECGGLLYAWEEFVLEERVMISKTGKRGKKFRTKPQPYACGDMWGIGCRKCGAVYNAVNGNDPAWERICERVLL